jgi:hypothetical protein
MTICYYSRVSLESQPDLKGPIGSFSRLLPNLVGEVDKTKSEGGERVIKMTNRSFLFGSGWLVLSTSSSAEGGFHEFSRHGN